MYEIKEIAGGSWAIYKDEVLLSIKQYKGQADQYVRDAKKGIPVS